MNIVTTKLAGAVILEPKVHGDNRGYFYESFNLKKFVELGFTNPFVQDNQAMSAAIGTLRGLHYQLNPMAQTKVVSVLKGEIYDVIVDIRRQSKTYGQWIGVNLSSENKRQLVVPRGFAHGYCTLTANSEVFYKVDNYYSPQHERGIVWNDSELGIDWPTKTPIIAEKDKNWLPFKNCDSNFDS